MSNVGTDPGREAFKVEASELLTELETSLLELEEAPDDEDLIGRVFRAMHTIKGSGAMFGFDDVAAFTHDVETVFDEVRNGKITVTKTLIDLTLSARDHIRALIDSAETGESVDEAKAGKITEGLRKLLPSSAEHTETPVKEVDSSQKTEERAVTYRVRFKPNKELFANGTNPIPLLNELRMLGECEIIAHVHNIPLLNELESEGCYTYWDIILTTDKGENAINDVFIFVDDDCEITIQVIDTGDALDDERDYKKLGEILIERGDVSKEELQKILAGKKRLGDMVVDAGLVKPDEVQAALVEQRHVRKVREKSQTKEPASSIRVPSEKLDTLVNLVGELVTVQARLSQVAIDKDDPEVILISEEVERLTSELRDDTMSIRMLPIGTTFSKFKRLVRDLSNELGREVILFTEGGETELDKTVIEKLNDPLVHIIRNSIDHGIESPAERTGKGKPREGKIHLSAEHSGANVLIRIKDDGKGISTEAVKAKAIKNGLITPDTELPDKEIYGLIFAPGFSTAEKVTSVSGRGVGMDVVKKNIDALRGSVEIESSEGNGTAITLKLPLTLAIIDGLLVKIKDDNFVISLSSVEECIELTQADIDRAHGRHMVNVRGELVPYIRLREWFEIDGKEPEIAQIVITEHNGRRTGFVVDYVVGEYQTVIKSLGSIYKDVEGLSGATILGDGTVALILDIQKMTQYVEKEELESFQ